MQVVPSSVLVVPSSMLVAPSSMLVKPSSILVALSFELPMVDLSRDCTQSLFPELEYGRSFSRLSTVFASYEVIATAPSPIHI
jgi:hypothetical protein